MNDFSETYSSFISHIKIGFQDNTFLENLLNEPIEDQLNRVKKLNDLLNTTTLFNFFLKNKIKIFSHKDTNTCEISESLFGSEITLKKIFNNQDDSVKLLFWTDLKYLILYYNKYLLSIDPNDKTAQDKVQNILNNIESVKKPFINPKEGLNKILKTENLNETTNNMINDIFSTFEKSAGVPGANPFANIMEISKIISEKYKTNIENGEVNLDDLLSNMTCLPGMENMGGIISSLSSQMMPKNPEPMEKIIIDENFSTSIVVTGEQKDETQNFNVGNLLKTMESFNSLGLNNALLGNNDELSVNNSMGKLMNVFDKLSSTSNPLHLNQIMEDELGIDMVKFTDEMTKTLSNND